MKKTTSFIAAAAAMLAGSGYDQEIVMAFPSPIFIPRKHTKMSYRTQQRNAAKRKKK